ncbi:1,4-alpha-glucan-branching enzyme 1, chloroplastic/amyloplastic [Mucuna pruriens]|uniref:1,4-alpha-glucan-branching enzyme 1, chloroplastic/amyloplastic n=1 Tax=Mucuna pruriens TaxID=157652 RepID=A0A371F686_MUCPR|nr:1,4-alpha-glucan-branching enzyme 1, chloroplastic/amyloplastic [Mucuna pruriens]
MVYTISGIRFPVVPSLHNSSFRGDRRTACLPIFIRKNFSRKILALKSSHDSDSLSSAIAESDKVLIPQDQDNSASLTGQLETPDITSEDAQNLEDLTMEDEDKYNISEAASSYRQIEDGQRSVVSSPLDMNIQAKKTSVSVGRKVKLASDEAKPKIIPPPGSGQKIYDIDPSLLAHREHLDFRYGQYKRLHDEINKHEGGLDTFSRGYEKFGFTRSGGQKRGSMWFQAHKKNWLDRFQQPAHGGTYVLRCGKLPARGYIEDGEQGGITYREWAPGAKSPKKHGYDMEYEESSAALIGDFNNWNPNADVMTRFYGNHVELAEFSSKFDWACALSMNRRTFVKGGMLEI